MATDDSSAYSRFQLREHGTVDLAHRSSQRAANLRAAANEPATGTMVALCECAWVECAAHFEVAVREFNSAVDRGEFFVIDGHELTELERESKGKSTSNAYKVIQQLWPKTRPELDKNTLKLAIERHAELLDRRRDLFKDVLTQLRAAMATAAVVLGLFGALRPGTNDLLFNLLFVVALVPFLGIVWLSLFRAQDAETELKKQSIPRWTTIPKYHFATYEQVARRILAQQETDPFAEALLSEEDWLVFELERHMYLQAGVLSALEKVEDFRLSATILLSVLVAYLVILTSLQRILA